jgi:hypothetical protein
MFGLGSRNPQLRYLRLALLAVVILAGLAFHHSGPAYDAIRIAYYVIIVGIIGFALYSRRGHRGQNPGFPHHPPGAGPSPTSPGPAGSPPGPTAGPTQNPGWYPDQQNMQIQRYWDGSAWTATRHWDGSAWVDGGGELRPPGP